MLQITYLGGLLEGLLVDSDEDDGMRSETVLGGCLDILDEVLAGAEVNEGVRAELLQAHLFLLVTSVDGDGSEAHGLGVLLSERPEPTTSTDNGDGLAGLGTGFLQSLVHGDTGTQDGGNGIKGNVLVQTSNMCSLGNAVLLESSVDSVTGEKSL